MKFIVKNELKESIIALGRKIGYYFLGKDVENGEMIFVRPPKGYPRFHLYLKTEGENLVFNLHLDQKKPIYPHTKQGQGAYGVKINEVSPRYDVGVYKGVPAHAGEYDSEIVVQEAERIKQMIQHIQH